MKAAIPEARQRPVQSKGQDEEDVLGLYVDVRSSFQRRGTREGNGGFEDKHQFLSGQGLQSSDCDHFRGKQRPASFSLTFRGQQMWSRLLLWPGGEPGSFQKRRVEPGLCTFDR